MGSVPWVIMSEVELARTKISKIISPLMISTNTILTDGCYTGLDADISHKYEGNRRELRDSGELVRFACSFFRLQLLHELEFFR